MFDQICFVYNQHPTDTNKYFYVSNLIWNNNKTEVIIHQSKLSLELINFN